MVIVEEIKKSSVITEQALASKLATLSQPQPDAPQKTEATTEQPIAAAQPQPQETEAMPATKAKTAAKPATKKKGAAKPATKSKSVSAKPKAAKSKAAKPKAEPKPASKMPKAKATKTTKPKAAKPKREGETSSAKVRRIAAANPKLGFTEICKLAEKEGVKPNTARGVLVRYLQENGGGKKKKRSA